MYNQRKILGLNEVYPVKVGVCVPFITSDTDKENINRKIYYFALRAAFYILHALNQFWNRIVRKCPK